MKRGFTTLVFTSDSAWLSHAPVLVPQFFSLGLAKSAVQIIDTLLTVFGQYNASHFATALLEMVISLGRVSKDANTGDQVVKMVLKAFPSRSHIDTSKLWWRSDSK
jgi:hypothetical protein